MPTDARVSKNVVVGTISTATEFTAFEGITLIDAGSDGYQLEDQNGNTCVIPTGIPISIGGPGVRNSGYLKVNAPASGTLNCSYIMYT